jgi:phage FluMu gp28-like protein
MALMQRTCIDKTGLGIGWVDDAQRKFGEYRVEGVTFTAAVKEMLAYPVRGKMQDKKVRIPYKPEIRADLRAVTKVTTAAGNIRFTAERSENGHADRFWAGALGIHAGGALQQPAFGSSVEPDRQIYLPSRMQGRRRGGMSGRPEGSPPGGRA